MMKVKKISSYFVRYMIVILLLGVYILEPINVKAASDDDLTLGDLKDVLENLKEKKRKTNQQQAVSEAEKAAKNKAISDAYAEIEESERKIAEAKAEIEASNVRIEELNKQTEDLMAFYQILNGNNVYLEFITDSSSMTDLIMRSDAVDQLASYNQEKLVELEELIESNEQLQVDLLEYEDELNANIASYKKQLEEIDSSILELSDISMDIDEEIEMQEGLIEMYEDAGCEDDEKISVCMSNSENAGWLKPVTKGRITSLFGWRSVPGQSSYHSGIDIGVSEGTEVYPAASGTVIRTVSRSSCGGNQIYIQSVVNGEVYTTQYAHLLKVYVSKGDVVNVNDVIALSGGYSTSISHGGYDSCTTGAHLHFGVSEGYYESFANYTANLINPPGFPGKGSWFYSRTQWFD